MAWLRRTLAFAMLTLTEYRRSGRIVIELLALVAFVWIFFWPRGSEGVDPRQFFNYGGLFILALAAFSTVRIVGLGRRPQAYVLLARPLGRSGYLTGLYLAAMVVSATMYVLLTLVVVGLNALHHQPNQLSIAVWLYGTLPLLLDIAVVVSFITLLTPLVLLSRYRLLLLALLALALTADLGMYERVLLGGALRPLHAALSMVLVPPLGGFALAVQHDYGPSAAPMLLAQLSLALVLFALALVSFQRREIILPA